MDERAQAGERRRETRVGVQATVDIRFEDFHSFLSTQTGNLSRGGMFVATDYPPPRGTLISFEMRLEDGYSLVRGRGEVVWSRPRGVVSDEPSGMGVRFAELEEDGRRLVERIVSDLEAGGRTPFDLDQLPGNRAGQEPAIAHVQTDRSDRPESGSTRRGPGSSSARAKSSLDDTAAALRRARAATTSRPRRGPWLVVIAVFAVAVLATAMWFGSRLLRSPQDATAVVAADVAGFDDNGARADRDVADAEGVLEPDAQLEAAVVAEPQATGEPEPMGAVGDDVSPASTQAQVAKPEVGAAFQVAAAVAVERIEWQRALAGGLVVAITCDGPLEPSRLRTDVLSGPPRVLLRLRGITERFRPFVIEVDEPELTSIRIGEHPELTPPELHVVLDLAGSNAGTPQVQGNTVRIVLEAE